MKIDKDDPFLDNADQWKNRSSWGTITIYTFEESDHFEDEKMIKSEINFTCHGLSKKEFEQWKSTIIDRPDIVRNLRNNVIISSFTGG